MASAPINYEDLREAITRRHEELSGRLRQIARYAVDHPNDVALNTVSELADTIGVQPSSIVRFANAFGYDGFSDMQRVFRTQLVAQTSPGYRARFKSGPAKKKSPGGSSDPVQVLQQEVTDNADALDELARTIEPRLLNQAIDFLANAQTIYIIAQGRSFPVAHYLAYALGRLELRAHLIDGVGGLTRIVGQMATTDDVLLAISFREYSPDVVGVVDEVAARNVPVISITDSPLSPIAPQAKVSFEIPSNQSRAFRSLVAPIALAQALVIALGHYLTADRQRS